MLGSEIQSGRTTRGGRWPTGPVSVDFNFVDEVWHECEFREGDSFTYAVYDSRGQYLGCCYLYPMGRRTPLTEELLNYEVDVSWWVTPDAYERVVDIRKRLSIRYPDVDRFRFSLSVSCFNISIAQGLTDRPNDAMASLQQARDAIGD